MTKIISILLTLLFLTGCGYTPIYSSKNFDFKLKNLTYTNNSQLNSKINRRLKSFSNEESQKVIFFKIDSNKKIITLSKDSKGDSARFEMIIKINLEIKNQSRSFEKRFNYNTNKNKFELKQYEKEIEDLLINKNIEDIIAYLTNT